MRYRKTLLGFATASGLLLVASGKIVIPNGHTPAVEIPLTEGQS